MTIENKEPQNIEGPVNFIYLVGNAGDNIIRKVLLLGDIHNPETSCESRSTMQVADFLRYVAKQLKPTILDLFIESEFSTSTQEVELPFEEIKGRYLRNLKYELRDCLTRDKSYCDEAMRIHYIDTRRANRDIHSFGGIYTLLENILHKRNFDTVEEWGSIKWPKRKDIEKTVKYTFDTVRLSNTKLSTLHPAVKDKFMRIIYTPIFNNLAAFYSNESNKKTFKTIKNILQRISQHTTSLSRDEYNFIQDFTTDCIEVYSYVMDMYFVSRLLKRTTIRQGERIEVALHPEEAITRIIGYVGFFHSLQIRDMLINMDFQLVSSFDNGIEKIKKRTGRLPEEIKQCIPYTLISNTIDDFCNIKDEGEDEFTYTKIVSSTELRFFQLAARANITPNLISVQPIHKGQYELTMEKYPTTLLQYSDAGGDITPYKPKIAKLIDKLHNMDILHGDLHGDNIVINPITEEVRIIDFGRSYFIDEITPPILRQLSNFLDKKFTSIDQLLKFETTMYKRGI
jgi:hypothetical protein